MKNSINWYVNKKRGNLYIRYNINGKIKDETLHNLDYYITPSQIKEVMGHSDVKTTLSYIGTSLQEKTKAVKNMPQLLGIDNNEISMI